MCVGTRCTHHIDPAVEEIERDYDSWEFNRWIVEDEDGNEYEMVHAAGRSGPERRHTGSTGHDQNMIRIKDDIGGLTEERIYQRLYCTMCANNRPHTCDGCNAVVMHMNGNTCTTCAEAAWIHERQVSPFETATNVVAAMQVAFAAQASRPQQSMVRGVRGARPSYVIRDEALAMRNDMGTIDPDMLPHERFMRGLE